MQSTIPSIRSGAQVYINQSSQQSLRILGKFVLMISAFYFFSYKADQLTQQIIIYEDQQTQKMAGSNFTGIMFIQKLIILSICFILKQTWKIIKNLKIFSRSRMFSFFKKQTSSDHPSTRKNSAISQPNYNPLNSSYDKNNQLPERDQSDQSPQSQIQLSILKQEIQRCISTDYIEPEQVHVKKENQNPDSDNNVLSNKYQGDNVKIDEFTSTEQIIAGVLGFMQISCLWKVVELNNMFFIEIQNHVSALLIVLMVHFIIEKIVLTPKKYIPRILPLVTIMICSSFVKISFYSSLQHLTTSSSQTFSPIFLIISLLSKNSLYLYIFYLRQKYKNRTAFFTFVYSVTRFMTIMFGIDAIFSNQLSFIVQLMNNSGEFLNRVILAGLWGFGKEIVVYSVLLRYDVEVFFAVVLSNGVAGFWWVGILVSFGVIGLRLVRQDKRVRNLLDILNHSGWVISTVSGFLIS